MVIYKHQPGISHDQALGDERASPTHHQECERAKVMGDKINEAEKKLPGIMEAHLVRSRGEREGCRARQWGSEAVSEL